MNNNTPSFNQVLKDFPPIHSVSKKEEQRLARSSKPEDKQALVLGFMREAFVYTHKCSYGNIEERELISLCYTALVASARLYRPNEQRFFPYAKPNLRGSIYRHWKSELVVRNATCVPLDTPDDDDTSDFRPCPAIVLPGADFDHVTIDTNERMEMVRKASGKLSGRESMVLELAYIGGYSFSRIGAMLKPRVTRSAVSLLHRRAIKKIRLELFRKQELFS